MMTLMNEKMENLFYYDINNIFWINIFLLFKIVLILKSIILLNYLSVCNNKIVLIRKRKN